jgi:hypothetical protein
MKRALVLPSIMLISITAFAGKEDREYMKNEVMPAVKSAETAYKASCGCALKITIDETTIKSQNDMPAARDTCTTIAESVKDYCADAASKKAMCQMKTLTFKKADDVTFTFHGGKGVATVYGITGLSFAMITRELDK